MDKPTERDDSCFCCGQGNEKGLHLVFSYPREGEAEASLAVPEHFSGWKRMTHGGFLSMLLDEVMAHACIGSAVTAVTGEITVRFRKPVETGTTVRLLGKVVEKKGRIIHTRGWILDSDGESAAEGQARFVAART